MPKLLIKHPEKGDLSFTLSGGRTSVGRRAENSIQINHGTVSGSHAEFVAVNGHYVLRDLGSTNYSFVDGEKIEEVDLTQPCKITFGTVECDYLPDDAKATGPVTGDLETLRKNVGILRAQNDELVAKVADQQKQIEILGSAKLLMRLSARGADEAELQAVTEERDAMKAENEALRQEISILRALAQTFAQSEGGAGLKETVPIKLAPAPAKALAAVAVSPDGATRTAAPVARVVGGSENDAILEFFAETVGKMRPLVANFAKDFDARSEMLVLCSRLVDKSASLGAHPAAWVAKAMEGLLRDVIQRENGSDAGILRTISLGVDTFAEMLEPANRKKLDGLPQPSVLAVDDDADFLPAMVAALEFGRLPATGCADTKQALTMLGESRFDLVILDLTLPDGDGLDICTSIRTYSNHEKTPIMILTGSDSLESRAQSSVRGGNDFLAKPCNLFELTLRAYSWVYKSQLGLLQSVN